jgi:hypothetical protein
MRLDCLVVPGVDLDIRPGFARRDWMDATLNRFAYRCLPLSIANAHGWVIGCRGAFEVEWNGGTDDKDVDVVPLGEDPVDAEGHFGSGILTINPQAMFRTEPGYNLWITGPPNVFKDGIQPLSAVVESDWIPYHFTMNWKITRPKHRIRFEKGEPYCFLFPIKRGTVEAMDPVMKDLEDEPEIKKQVDYANRMRSFRSQVKTLLKREGSSAALANEKMLKFQKWYMQGRMPDGSSVFEAHQKSIEPKTFEDRRK